MMRAIMLVYLCLSICGYSQKELDENKRDPFKFCVVIPDVTYSVQVGHSAQIQGITNPYMFKDKMRFATFEILNPYIILYEQFKFGARISSQTGSKRKGMYGYLQQEKPYHHLVNFTQERSNFFVPSLFVGYEFNFGNRENLKHGLGLNLYLNFDHFDYGNYAYEAKSTSNNSFYTYYFNAENIKSKSLTFEVVKFRHFKKAGSTEEVKFGFKMGVTPRNQSISFLETVTDVMNDQITVTHKQADFRFWTYHMGIIVSLSGLN